MENEHVTFKARWSCGDNCFCEACHRSDKVIKIDLPHTMYKHVGGEELHELVTGRKEIWLCKECAGALRAAMDNAPEE